MSATIQRMGLVSALALSALSVYACGDDDDDDNPPGDGDGDGDGDAGGDGDGDGDGDAGAPMDSGTPLSCGEGAAATSCESVEVLPGVALPACCADTDADAGAAIGCGLNTAVVSAVTNGLFPPGCVARNNPYAPPGDTQSNVCTNLWEGLDAPEAAGTTANGFTINVAGQVISLPGCCRVEAGKGVCGFAVDTVLGANVGFGCLPLDTFKNAFVQGDAGVAQFEQLKAIAVCNPVDGEAVTPTDAGADAN